MANLITEYWIQVSAAVTASAIVGAFLRFRRKDQKIPPISTSTLNDSSVAVGQNVIQTVTYHPISASLTANGLSTADPSPSKLTVEMISQKYERSTPFERDSFGNEYRGVKICWNLVFVYMSASRDGRWRIVGRDVNSQPQTGWSIKFSIKLEDYPDFKFASEGQQFNASGIIEEANLWGICLKDVTIQFQ